MKIGTIDDSNRTVINNCDSCKGDHEVILKTVNDNLASKGFIYWFECPQHGQGGPVMISAPAPEPVIESTITAESDIKS